MWSQRQYKENVSDGPNKNLERPTESKIVLCEKPNEEMMDTLQIGDGWLTKGGLVLILFSFSHLYG